MVDQGSYNGTMGGTLRQVTPGGAVTTVAGTPGINRNTLASGPVFNFPYAVATDGTYLYVADTNNHCIRRVTISDWTVVNAAGTAPSAGSGASELRNPYGVAVDANASGDGTLYVAD